MQHVFESHGVNAAEYSSKTLFKRVYREFINDETLENLRTSHPKVNQGAIDVLKVRFVNGLAASAVVLLLSNKRTVAGVRYSQW